VAAECTWGMSAKPVDPDGADSRFQLGRTPLQSQEQSQLVSAVYLMPNRIPYMESPYD
jgi:hypothetical protein